MDHFPTDLFLSLVSTNSMLATAEAITQGNAEPLMFHRGSFCAIAHSRWTLSAAQPKTVALLLEHNRVNFVECKVQTKWEGLKV